MNMSPIATTSDSVIRFALREILSSEHKDEPKTKIVEEFGVKHGEVRADMAVINGSLHGYELKSDLDTFNRLPNQMSLYNLVFDKMTLVVGRSHLHKAIYSVPDWWGIKLAKIDKKNKGVVFVDIREAEQNDDQNCLAIVQLLWKNEAISILNSKGICKGLKSKTLSNLYDIMVNLLKKEEVKELVREKLKERYTT